MTNTKIITAGVLPVAGADGVLITKVALNAATTLFTLEAVVTNGANSEGTKPLKVELRFVTSNVALTANAAAVAEISQGSETKSCVLKSEGLAVTHFHSKPFVPTGAQLYVWFNSANLPLAAAVDVWLNENV